MSGMATLLFGLFASIIPQVDQPSPERLPSFETLARKTETGVIDSKEVGHLTGGESHAVFTILIVEDPTPEHPRVRGVRIDLSQPFWQSSVYVDEGLLQSVKKDFDGLAMFLAGWDDLIKQGVVSSSTTVGLCSRRTDRVRYPLSAGFIGQGPDLVLVVNTVWFPGVMPSQVSDILGKAIDELKRR